MNANTCWATASVLYDGMFVTAMPSSRAASISMMLYPVAVTPMYFREARASILRLSNGTLLVITTCLPAHLSSTRSSGVLS